MALLINDLCITCDVCLAPCPNKAITAGEDIFTISPLGYEETCDLQPLLAPALADFGRLYALFIGEMARLLQQHGAEVAEADVVTMLPELGGSLDQASAIIAQVAAKLPATSLRTIRRTLLRGATMNSKPLYATTEGQPDMINTLMRGRTIDGWKLLLFALEVNSVVIREVIADLL